MVKRNCPLPFIFYCLTDNIYDLPQNVVGIGVDKELALDSYWWKMCLFSLNWNELILYFDLDLVIQNDLTNIIKKIKRNKILLIKPDDAGIDRSDDIILKHDAIVNSSVIGMYPVDHKDVFNFFTSNIDYNIINYYGIDRLISHKFLQRCNYLDFSTDYYFRWKHDNTPSIFCENKIINNITYSLAKDPNKTLCIFSQAEQEMYEGMEEYLL